MKHDISFVAQIADMDSGEILSQQRKRVDPNIGVVRSFNRVLEIVSHYLDNGVSVTLDICFILSGFSDRNNKQLEIF